MTLKQISVFVENKLGKLQQLTDALAANQINLRALSLAETSDFGIVRVIVDELERACDVLTAEHFVYTVTKVLGVAVPDEPGGLSRVLNVLKDGGINVEYMYAFLGCKEARQAYMIFHVQDPAAACAVLAGEGIACLGQNSLAGL